MAHKAICFDLDGTLLDTLADIGGCMNTTLEQFGFPVHSLERYKIFVGDGMENLARRALPEGQHTDARVTECVAGMRNQYGKRWKETTRPYEGVTEMLDALTARGIKLTVLSNKPDDFSKVIVKEFFGDWKFEAVFGARLNVPKKPDPAGAFEIAALLELPPEDFLYMGDTNTDMWTAKAAGMYALGALWGFRPAQEMQDAGAMALLKHPSEVINFI